MKRRRHNLIPLHQRRLPCVFRKNLQAWPSPLDDRTTNENHLQRFLLQFCRAGDDVAGDLPAIAVSQHGHIQQLKGILLRIFHFRGEQYCSRARPEYGAPFFREFLDGVRQTFFPQKLQLRCALATRKNQPAAALELRGSAHLRRFHTDPLQHRRVRLKVSLHRQNSDLQFPVSESRSSIFEHAKLTTPASRACPSLPSAAHPIPAWLRPTPRELRAQSSRPRSASPLSPQPSLAPRGRWT